MNLRDLDAQLAKVLLVPHVLIRIFELLQTKNLLIDNGVDVVLLDGAVHVFELQPRADKEASYSAHVVQGLDERGLLLIEATDEADDT